MGKKAKSVVVELDFNTPQGASFMASSASWKVFEQQYLKEIAPNEKISPKSNEVAKALNLARWRFESFAVWSALGFEEMEKCPANGLVHPWISMKAPSLAGDLKGAFWMSAVNLVMTRPGFKKAFAADMSKWRSLDAANDEASEIESSIVSPASAPARKPKRRV